MISVKVEFTLRCVMKAQRVRRGIHVQAYSKLIIKKDFCALSWLITKIKINLAYSVYFPVYFPAFEMIGRKRWVLLTIA